MCVVYWIDPVDCTTIFGSDLGCLVVPSPTADCWCLPRVGELPWNFPWANYAASRGPAGREKTSSGSTAYRKWTGDYIIINLSVSMICCLPTCIS